MRDKKRVAYKRFALNIAFMLTAGFVLPALAQTEGLPDFHNPPLLNETSKNKIPTPTIPINMNVEYVDSQLRNPTSGRNDKVRLRNYTNGTVNGTGVPTGGTLTFTPGNEYTIIFNNLLPKNTDPGCPHMDGHDINMPHCFNTTNLHTHGLWISPSGSSDNVLLSIEPQHGFAYHFNIPSDHPAGTFWYHAHQHGSTAIQVGSGMGGALIIRGERYPSMKDNGDIDTLLRPKPDIGINDANEGPVVLLQQIQYYCRDTKGQIKTNSDGTYRCDAGDVGEIDNYDEFGPRRWLASGRYTSINGLVMPVFHTNTEQIQRWRIIHAGVRDTVDLQFRKLRPGAPTAGSLSIQQQQTYIDQHCTGEIVSQHQMAADGLTMSRIVPTQQTVFQPGYRWDLLMLFPTPGTYCVIDQQMPAGTTVAREAHSRRLLGMVNVTGSPVTGDSTTLIQNRLIKLAEANFSGAVRDKVIADLRSGLSLSKFTPHPDVTDHEVNGYQTLVFNIVNPTDPLHAQFHLDGKSYDPHNPPRVLPLGGVQEWTVESEMVGHPHHIHVNAFQIVKILDPNGRDVSVPGVIDDASGAVDPQYAGMKGVWKDTVWVKNFLAANSGRPPKEGMYKVIIRTRYERYDGDFVLHCHILDHEDQGMMELVRISKTAKK